MVTLAGMQNVERATSGEGGFVSDSHLVDLVAIAHDLGFRETTREFDLIMPEVPVAIRALGQQLNNRSQVYSTASLHRFGDRDNPLYHSQYYAEYAMRFGGNVAFIPLDGPIDVCSSFGRVSNQEVPQGTAVMWGASVLHWVVPPKVGQVRHAVLFATEKTKLHH